MITNLLLILTGCFTPTWRSSEDGLLIAYIKKRKTILSWWKIWILIYYNMCIYLEYLFFYPNIWVLSIVRRNINLLTVEHIDSEIGYHNGYISEYILSGITSLILDITLKKRRILVNFIHLQNFKLLYNQTSIKLRFHSGRSQKLLWVYVWFIVYIWLSFYTLLRWEIKLFYNKKLQYFEVKLIQKTRGKYMCFWKHTLF